MTREMGIRYSLLAVAYLAVTSWSVATLFYQIAVAGDPLWIVVALVLLELMAGVFWAIGRWARPIESRIGRSSAPAKSSAC
jgi:hypothetical protein